MRLPHAEQAVIDAAKLRDYLLSDTHPVGRFKSAFFRSLGYTAAGASELAAALRTLAERGEAELDAATRTAGSTAWEAYSRALQAGRQAS